MIGTQQNLTTIPIRAQIESMVSDIPGWSPIDQLCTLFQLVQFTSGLPGDILEIGSWCGRSALVLGLAARLTGNSRVHCVDYFPELGDWSRNPDGSYSFRVNIGGQTYGGHQEQTVWKEPFERDIVPVYNRNESLLGQFLENVARYDFQDLIVPCKGNSDAFLRSAGPGFRCRVAFIDGEHHYDSVCRDIDNVTRRLVPGGWICFDDAFSAYEGVDRAIRDRVIGNPGFDLAQQMTRKLFIARKKP